MGIVKGESVLFTKTSRSLETHPLRAFIMTSICSFIACIFTRMGGRVVSMREGMLKFRCSGLLGSLLPSGLLGPLCSELSPWFSTWTLCPVSLYRSCSSRLWFCFVRRSTAAAKVWTCLSSAVDLGGSSSWTLLVVAIECVSTMQLLCLGGDNGLNCQDLPTDGANWWGHKSHQWEARSLCLKSHLHKRRKQEHLAEGTGVEPAKYPPKVKLEIFSQL